MQKLSMLLVGLLVLLSFYLTINLLTINSGFGEQYIYKFTKNESDLLIISELCYADIDISECNLIYGGIDTNYGDKIK